MIALLAIGQIEIVHILVLDLVGYSKLSMDKQTQADELLRDTICSLPTFRMAQAAGQAITLDTGDGVIVVFRGDPTYPIVVGLEFARAWREEGTQPCRIGAHSGPAMPIKDIGGHSNYKGVGMNVAARVLECANPGEVTMTEYYASILSGLDEYSSHLVKKGVYRVKHGLKLRIWKYSDTTVARPESPAELLSMSGVGVIAAGLVALAGSYAAGAALGVPQDNYRAPTIQPARDLKMPSFYYSNPDAWWDRAWREPWLETETYQDGSLGPFYRSTPRKRS